MEESIERMPAVLPQGQPELTQHESEPENAEFPMAYLNGWMTPNRLFYRRSHFSYPAVDLERWELTVTGLVSRPLRLSLERMRSMAQSSQWTTLECSGNKRRSFTPKTEGVKWGDGAIGNAEWGGVPLIHLLRLAGLRPGAVAVAFAGADAGPFPETGEIIPFARSLPLHEALRPDLLVALTMNGEPLPPEHGAPARLVVPGWYAMASVKWLTRIELRAEPLTGPFQVRDYVYLPQKGAYGAALPVTVQKVNSTITQPADGARVSPGPLVIRGAAWGGTEPHRRVEVSLDGGRRWFPATWSGPALPQTWRLWHYESPPLAPGRYLLLARAIDARGRTQPLEAEWNAKGYGNNAMVPVRVSVGE